MAARALTVGGAVCGGPAPSADWRLPGVGEVTSHRSDVEEGWGVAQTVVPLLVRREKDPELAQTRSSTP